MQVKEYAKQRQANKIAFDLVKKNTTTIIPLKQKTNKQKANGKIQIHIQQTNEKYQKKFATTSIKSNWKTTDEKWSLSYSFSECSNLKKPRYTYSSPFVFQHT